MEVHKCDLVCLQCTRMESINGKCSWCVKDNRKHRERGSATTAGHILANKRLLPVLFWLAHVVRQINRRGSKFGKKKKKSNKKNLRCFCGGPNVFLEFKSLNTVRNKVRVTSKENCTFVLQTDWLQGRTLAYVSELLGVALTLTSETLNRWLQQRSVFCFTTRQLR